MFGSFLFSFEHKKREWPDKKAEVKNVPDTSERHESKKLSDTRPCQPARYLLYTFPASKKRLKKIEHFPFQNSTPHVKTT